MGMRLCSGHEAGSGYEAGHWMAMRLGSRHEAVSGYEAGQ